MPPDERADPKAGPSADTAPEYSTRSDRFVFVPLRFRREHRDWSNAEHAAWLDLFLASFEVEGTFDSPEVARAYLGPRAAALDALIARDEFVEQDDGTWILADYLEMYDRRRPRHYKTLAERLADADAKQARGEPLEPIERWARWKARQKAKRAESESEQEEGSKDKERDTANVGPTLANDLSPCPECGGDLIEKVGKHGPFIGCSSFPDCNYIQRVPKPKGWTPSAADLAIIQEQTPTLRRVS